MGVQDEIRGYIVENILFGDGQKLEADTPFHEGGILDSTGFLEIITFVEEKFDVKIADEEVVPANLSTLRKICHFVEKKLHAKMASVEATRHHPVSIESSPCAG